MSDHESVECGTTPVVRVELVRGDLTVAATDGSELEAIAPSGGDVAVRRDGDAYVVTATRNCRLRLPRAASVTVEEVRGDLKVRGLEAELEIQRVGGDVDVAQGVDSRIGKVGGNLKASAIRGNLALDRAGGDVRLSDVTGSAHVALGGDLTVKGGRSPMEATAGGDAWVQVEITEAGPVSIEAGGDITCRLGGSPSADVALTSGGDRSVDLPGIGDQEASSGRFTLGDGGPEVLLTAGGDVRLVGEGGSIGMEDLDDIGSRVAASVGKTLAEVEAGLSAMGAVMESVPETEISSKVQKVVERAMRRGKRRRIKTLTPLPVSSGAGNEAAVASDEERMKILKMVESGKLSVEEAEKLFEALEA